MDLPFARADLLPSNSYIIRIAIDLSRSSDIKAHEILLPLGFTHQPVPGPTSPIRQTLF